MENQPWFTVLELLESVHLWLQWKAVLRCVKSQCLVKPQMFMSTEKNKFISVFMIIFISDCMGTFETLFKEVAMIDTA